MPKIVGLVENIYNHFKNMVAENIIPEIKLKNIDEAWNYFLEEIKQNELMSKKQKKVSTTLNYFDLNKNFLILASANTGCISISAFTYLFGIPIEITSSAIVLKICAITAGNKKV